jgi:nucleotide-binding universal stress UspA family protein
VHASRILVAVSSPTASRSLTEPVVDLARRLGSEAVVAHVARLRDEDETEADPKNRGDQTLQMLSAAMQGAGVPVQSVMLFSDDVAKAILNTARAQHCTLIVLGLTARGLLGRLLGRDVAGQIMRHADIPVLLCPLNWNRRF